MKHHTTRAAALLAALTLCAASAWAAMPDAEFARLCYEGTAEQVRKALEDGANPNARNEDGDTALHRAARGENLPVVQALLKAGADPNAKVKYTGTPLHTAAQGDHQPLPVVRALLDAGADPNAKDDYGETPLHEAAQGDRLPVVQALLKAGADPNAKTGENGMTPLTHAVLHDNLAVVQALLGAGADPNAKQDGSRTPLTAWGDGEEQTGRPSAKVFKAMLEAGADVNGGCGDGEEGCATPLVVLMRSGGGGDAASIRVLLEGGAARNRKGLDWALREVPLHGTPETADLLLKAGANPNAKDDDGQTALMNAARFGKRRIVEVLLGAGADPKAKDGEGHDALWHARHPVDWDWLPISKADQAEIVRLLQGGAKKPAAQDAGAFSAADLKRMSTFVSNFVEVRFPDFDMKQSGDAGTLHLGGDPSHPMLMYFGIWHNYTNNYKSRVKPCSGEGCKYGNSVMEAKFVAESVKKYFDIELKHRSAPDADDSPRFHFDGRLYHFEAADGELASEAKVTRAVREGDIIRMTGDIYLEDDPNNAVGSFIATAKPHKWNGKDTWAILSLKTENR